LLELRLGIVKLLGRLQRIEHYEIAAYGTDIALAEALGEEEVVELLSFTLAEEKETDLKLTEVTKQHMPAAMQAEEEDAEEPASRKKEAARRARP
jgi:ferritin-like metal-binding protein YciE